MVDTREHYGYRFAGGTCRSCGLRFPRATAAVQNQDGAIVAAVERKTLENLATTLSDGTLAFQMQRLAELPLSAVVVEGRYPALLSSPHVPAAWLGDVLARLQVRYPEVQVVFADSRRFAEEWMYRFLAAAVADAPGETPG